MGWVFAERSRNHKGNGKATAVSITLLLLRGEDLDCLCEITIQLLEMNAQWLWQLRLHADLAVTKSDCAVCGGIDKREMNEPKHISLKELTGTL